MIQVVPTIGDIERYLKVRLDWDPMPQAMDDNLSKFHCTPQYISLHYRVFFYLVCVSASPTDTYITTAKTYIMVFYYLFQDSISGFNMCFLSLGVQDLCISYAPLLVMIFLIHHYTLIVPHTLFQIYLEGFQGQTCSHSYFLPCFPYIFLAHMGGHFLTNKVATPHLTRTNKNQNFYQSALLPSLLAQSALRAPLAPVQYYPHRVDRAQSSHI